MTRFLQIAFAAGTSIFLATASLGQSVQQAVDSVIEAAKTAAAEEQLEPVVEIDHARLAAAAGVEMPSSRVALLSDPKINTQLLSSNIRAGLDLPFRVLSFDDNGKASAVFTSSEFLKIRHGIADTNALEDFDDRLAPVLQAMSESGPRPVQTSALTLDYGIIELASSHGVPETVAKLKEAITAQADTVWFGEVDYAAQAQQLGSELVPAVLLLFGGPAPGGVAMANFPSIGIDAFCQKILVYASPDGGSVVIFNDIAALAELHYGTSAPPHAALNERLTATFLAAIE
ncbi:DUF302 domain-containing protein [Defluviimonas salinarum]|nr:DUF302 domain-containing protein [Defluviimonas salinarum]